MIDILIAHYKEPWEQLDRLLTSINNQSYGLDQITVHIINDGEEVIFNKNSFTKYDFPVTYEIVSHRGTSKIRNLLLQKAKSKYIWYLDPDDYILPDSFAKIFPILKQSIDLVVVGAEREWKQGEIKFFCPSFTSFSIVGCTILRREFMLENNLICDESVKLAGDLIIEAMPKHYAKTWRRLKEPILHYSYEPTSVVHIKSNGWREEANRVTEHIIKRLVADGKYQAARLEFNLYLFAYNSKYIYETCYKILEDLNILKIDYKLDLR